MIFTCDKLQLQEALALATRAVANRSTNPILECILVKAETGVGITLIGNDKDIFIETAPIPAEIEENGSIALDAKLFTEIIRRITGDSVVIEKDKNFNAICKSGRSRLKIAGQSPDEFPVISENELNDITQRYKIGTAKLKNMIKKTIFSVSQDTSRPILTGEKMEVKNNLIQLVALDMFRIAYAAEELTDAEESTAVIPNKALNELSRILPDSEEEVNISFTQNKAVFETENFKLITSLLAGEFVRYNQIYNEDFSTMVVVERLPFLSAFERAVLVASENKTLPVKLEIGDDDIKIEAFSERGKVEDGIPCETEGKDLTIYFNPKYYIDVLRAVEDERIIIKFNNELSPCIIYGSESEKNLRYLIVPLRPPA